MCACVWAESGAPPGALPKPFGWRRQRRVRPTESEREQLWWRWDLVLVVGELAADRLPGVGERGVRSEGRRPPLTAR